MLITDIEKILLKTYHTDNHIKKYINFVKHYSKYDGYGDRHHILPRSLYPEYDKSSWNIVKVPIRVHFILHYLLWKITNTYEMAEAFRLMKINSSRNSRLYALEMYRVHAARRGKVVAINNITGKYELIQCENLNITHYYFLKDRKWYNHKISGEHLMLSKPPDDIENYNIGYTFDCTPEKKYWNSDGVTQWRSKEVGKNSRLFGFQEGLDVMNSRVRVLDIDSKKYVYIDNITKLPLNYIKTSGNKLDNMKVVIYNNIQYISKKSLPSFLKGKSIDYNDIKSIHHFSTNRVKKYSKYDLAWIKENNGKSFEEADIEIYNFLSYKFDYNKEIRH